MMNLSWCNHTGPPHLKLITADDNALSLFVVFISIVTCATIVGNLLILLSLVHYRIVQRRTFYNPTKSDSTITTMLMTSMVIADSCVGLLVMPLGVVEIHDNGKWRFGFELCSIRSLFDLICISLSIYHVISMAIDRYLAICWPLVYRRLTRKIGFVMIGVCWVTPVAVVMIPVLVGWHHPGEEMTSRCAREMGICLIGFTQRFMFSIFVMGFYLPFVAIFVLYCCIVRQLVRSGGKQRNFDLGSGSLNPGSKSLKAFSRSFKFGSLNSSRLKSWKSKPATYFRRSFKNSIGVTDRPLKQPEENAHCVVDPIFFVSIGKTSTTATDHCSVNTCKSVGESPKAKPTNHRNTKELKNLDSVNNTKILNAKAPATFNDQKIETSKSDTNTMSSLDKDYKDNKASLQKDQTLQDNDVTFHRIHPSLKCSFRHVSPKRKAVRTIGIVVLCFYLCWFPTSIVGPMSFFRTSGVPTWVLLFFNWVGFTNSAINPVLFCFNHTVRGALKLFIDRLLSLFYFRKNYIE